MGHLPLRSSGAVVLTAALALLLAITLVPNAVSAQEVQRAPEEHEDHKLGRHGIGNQDEDYADSFGVQEVGHWESLGFNADVWGHGRYAYVGSWGSLSNPPETCPSQGVRVIDLVDPRNPRLVATFADAESYPELEGSWTEKVVVADVDSDDFSGTLAAVSVQNCEPDGARGWSVWDVTAPEDPDLLHFEETEPEVETRAGSHEIFLESREDGSAYVYTAEILREQRQSRPEDDHFEPDLQIWDVSEPTDPDNVGSWGVWQDEGLEPPGAWPDEDDVPRALFVHSVIVAEGVAYVSYWDRGTVLLDVSDPGDPELISSVDIPTEGTWSRGNAHSAWLAEAGELLIETNEVFSPTPQEDSDQEFAFGYPRFTDISDPENPEVVGTFEMDSTRMDPEDLPPGDWTTHDPKVRPGLPGTDDTAYFSWYSEGVVVTDISDPADVDQTAQFVPPAYPDPFGVFQPSDIEFPFIWGVFLQDDFAGRGLYALASDINSGLWVFRLDEEVPEGLCDDLQPAEFNDLSEANTHFLGVSCVVQAAIAIGTSVDPPMFSPLRSVTRAQMATFVAQTLNAAGYDLPEPGDQVFDDVAPGHTHYENINRLARAGIVMGVGDNRFNPGGNVNRGQTATFLIQGLEHALGEEINPGGDVPFPDAAGTTHEDNVTSAAELGLVVGHTDGNYRPFQPTRRDQMATVVTRLLGSLEFTLFPGDEDPDDDNDNDNDNDGNGNGNGTDPTDPHGHG